MIPFLSPQTRILLAECRSLAMIEDVESVIKKLENFNLTSKDHSKIDSQLVIEGIAISLLKAELLHLDMKDSEAIEIFSSDINPCLTSLPPEIELVIEQNKVDIEVVLWQGNNIARSFDERNVAEVEFWDPKATVYAYESAVKGEHYDALPAFWQELKSTYHKGSWLFNRYAAKRLAIEWLQLGFGHLAVYQAIIAQNKDLVETIGEHLLAWRDSERIRITVELVLKVANLKRHAIFASIFHSKIADAIPDDMLDDVFNWLLKRCNLVPQYHGELNLSISVWNTMLSLRHRLSIEQANNVLEAAINHPLWKEPNHLRKHLLKAVNATIRHASPEKLIEVSNKALPIVTDKKEDIDYDDALNLVCHVAQRSEEAKNIIGNSLYDAPHTEDPKLMQLAPIFGKSLRTEDVERLATEVTSDICLQVQFHQENEEVKRPRIIFASLTSNEITVHIYAFSLVDVLLEYRKVLSEPTIEALVNSILEMIISDANIPANKVGLLGRLIEFADCLTHEQAEIIFGKLSPIADGNHLYPPTVMEGMSNLNHPLSPYKMSFQKPEDVQGSALFALSRIEEIHPNVYGEKLKPLLEKAMNNPNIIVRKFAFSSVRKINVLGNTTVANLLMGTRDSNAEISTQAYLALAENEHLEFNDADWLALWHSLSSGFNSQDSKVRRDAAYVIARRKSQWENTEIAEKMKELRNNFANDVCYSVRATTLQTYS